MTEDEFRKKFTEFRSRPIEDPILATAKFLRIFVLDNYPSETKKEIIEFASNDPDEAMRDLIALKTLIADKLIKPGVLSELVEEEGGKPLDEPKDDEARNYLQGLVDIFHEVL
jgi:hypothetical protein